MKTSNRCLNNHLV